MLVSMECLIGAAYTNKVADKGLTGRTQPTMGRVDADFADWRIGVLSRWAQRWVDRNFALDYTLKSLEKIMDDEPRQLVRSARNVLKRASYDLLGEMLGFLGSTTTSPATQRDTLGDACHALVEAKIEELRSEMSHVVSRLSRALPTERAALFAREHRRWADAHTWQLINAADTCDT